MQQRAKELPKYELISTYENYLLDENGNRVKRICGCPSVRHAIGFVCQSLAGLGTTHVGVGRCRHHDKGRKAAVTNAIYDELSRRGVLQSGAVLLKQYHDLIAATDIEINDLSGEIRQYYAMVAMLLDQPDMNIVGGRVGLVNKVTTLVEKIVTTKEAQKRMELASKYIEVAEVDRLVKTLMGIVISEIGVAKATRVFDQLERALVVKQNPNLFKIGDENALVCPENGLSRGVVEVERPV